MKRLISIPALATLALAAGCIQSTPSPNPKARTAVTTAQAPESTFVLPQEPPGAKGVKDVRKEAKDGDAVVLVARIGGEEDPWTKGRASFFVIDTSFKPCEEGCPTPWDFCCDDRDEKLKGMATVKFVDEQGKTVATDARELLKVKELDTVVVRGTAKRDEEGNLVVVADGLYRRPNVK